MADGPRPKRAILQVLLEELALNAFQKACISTMMLPDIAAIVAVHVIDVVSIARGVVLLENLLFDVVVVVHILEKGGEVFETAALVRDGRGTTRRR